MLDHVALQETPFLSLASAQGDDLGVDLEAAEGGRSLRYADVKESLPEDRRQNVPDVVAECRTHGFRGFERHPVALSDKSASSDAVADVFQAMI